MRTSAEINQEIDKKFGHLTYINDFSFEEKLEYFSLLVGRYTAFIHEKPKHAVLWKSVVNRYKRKVKRYKDILETL